jgi:hypothetical protein
LLIHYIDCVRTPGIAFSGSRLEKCHRFSFAAVAGTMGAQSVLLCKCCAVMLQDTLAGTTNMFLYPTTYAVLFGVGVSVYFQVKWLNDGLLQYDALFILPVFQAFWILVSVISGMIYFDEFREVFRTPKSAILFPLGVLLSISGVVLLSQRTDGSSHIRADPTPLIESMEAGEEGDTVGGAEENTSTRDITFRPRSSRCVCVCVCVCVSLRKLACV